VYVYGRSKVKKNKKRKVFLIMDFIYDSYGEWVPIAHGSIGHEPFTAAWTVEIP